MMDSLLSTVLCDSLAILDVRHSRSSQTIYAGLQVVFAGHWPFELLVQALDELELRLRARVAAHGFGELEIRREPLYARDALLLLRLRRCGRATGPDVDAALRAVLEALPVVLAPARAH